MKIHFEEVGRQKKSWTAEVATEADLTHEWLVKQVRKSGALMSQGIECIVEGDHGRIYAGMHSVGSIRIESQPQA